MTLAEALEVFTAAMRRDACALRFDLVPILQVCTEFIRLMLAQDPNPVVRRDELFLSWIFGVMKDKNSPAVLKRDLASWTWQPLEARIRDQGMSST